jgi:hypothetical protein
MTYPGIEGQRGPGWLSTTAFQVRQSHAGSLPGYSDYNQSGVLYSEGPHAAASAVDAAAITVMQEVAEDPHPIEAENFQLDFKQYNNPPGTGEADPGYTGQ